MNINCVLGRNASQNTAIFKIFVQSLYILVNATVRVFSLATQQGTLWHQSYFARIRFSAYRNRWASSGWFVCFWRDSTQWARASLFPRFLDHTQQRATVGSTPLDEWSARRRDLYLVIHTTLTTDKRPCPPWDSNPQSQQASGRRPTPSTARPLGPAFRMVHSIKVCDVTHTHR